MIETTDDSGNDSPEKDGEPSTESARRVKQCLGFGKMNSPVFVLSETCKRGGLKKGVDSFDLFDPTFEKS